MRLLMLPSLLSLMMFLFRMILGEAGQAGGSKVNFQKASCTLDASVKIYSHRCVAITLYFSSIAPESAYGDETLKPLQV